MLRAVLKNRKVLRGYSIIGSFLTFVSIVGFEVAYYLLGNMIGFVFGWGNSCILVHSISIQFTAEIEGHGRTEGNG